MPLKTTTVRFDSETMKILRNIRDSLQMLADSKYKSDDVLNIQDIAKNPMNIVKISRECTEDALLNSDKRTETEVEIDTLLKERDKLIQEK